MSTLDDAAAMAMRLPEVTEGAKFRHRTWFVDGKGFAWERPFSKADIKRFGTATPPDGPILAIKTADLGEKEAIIAANPVAFFSIEHFAGYPAVLVNLPKITKKALNEAIIDGWLACAPPKLAEAYLKR
ncbi:MAG TPA: hypothetical protein VHX38_10155 [Pseudonocardiaceae bacterium]|nr:hypothetical protein [Pseudonocardiaceae bacterium]